MTDDAPITDLLAGGRGGDRDALDQLAAAVYPELRRIARGYLRREADADTLQPTALVNEAYARVAAEGLPGCASRGDFYALLARRMRQVLVDHARARKAEKRGGGAGPVTLDDALVAAEEDDAAVLSLHDALEELARFDARKARLLELRFFAGLSIEESAEALGVSVATVGRDQRLAQAWLHRRLSPERA